MSNIEQFSVGGVTYNIAQVSALDQKSMLLMLGGMISFKSSNTDGEIDSDFLFGNLLTLPEEKFDRLANMILPRVFKSGSNTCVSVDDFQGKMVDLFTIMTEAVSINLSDFFMWLDARRTEEQKNPVQSK